MKRGKKVTAILVTAMVMTVAMVVVAYAEYAKSPNWNTGTGRYTQLYEMSVGTNWRYTSQIDGYSVMKSYPDRDGLVQCTSNGLTTFPTYYQIYAGSSEAFPYSYEACFTGTGTSVIDIPYPVTKNTYLCLGIRHDPRDNTNVLNRGSWSPDTY